MGNSLRGGGGRARPAARIVLDAGRLGKFPSVQSPGGYTPNSEARFNKMGYNETMNAEIPIAQILSLPMAERILLVEAIWDRIAREADSIPVTEAQKAELEGARRELGPTVRRDRVGNKSKQNSGAGN